jgi:DNA polymerase
VIAGGGFEGASGALLAKIVVAMGFAPEQVLLVALDREISSSDRALRKALVSTFAEVAPAAVVALGEKAAQLILESADPISRLRGRLVKTAGVSVMATLHPDQLLADETLKREVWNEMKKVMALLAGKP